jgi:hypothetical protein
MDLSSEPPGNSVRCRWFRVRLVFKEDGRG